MKATTRKQRQQRGQALVEFTLGVVVLLLLVGGLVDLGRMYFAYAAASEGAREGVIYGSTAGGAAGTAPSVDAIRDRVRKSSSWLSTLADEDIEIKYCTGSGSSKSCTDAESASSSLKCSNVDDMHSIQVTVTYPLPLVGPLTAAMFANPFPVRATEEAVILSPPCP